MQTCIEASGGLPPGRARVLVAAGRKAGLFTSEGRGKRARIGAADAVSALLMVLHVDLASEAVATAEALRALPLWSVEMFDATGHLGGSGAARFFATAPAEDLPPRLECLEAAATLGAALRTLYDDRDGQWIAHHFDPNDRLELTRTRDAVSVDLHLAEYGGERWWRLRFMAPADENAVDAGTIVTSRTVRGRLLDALARLVEG